MSGCIRFRKYHQVSHKIFKCKSNSNFPFVKYEMGLLNLLFNKPIPIIYSGKSFRRFIGFIKIVFPLQFLHILTNQLISDPGIFLGHINRRYPTGELHI